MDSLTPTLRKIPGTAGGPRLYHRRKRPFSPLAQAGHDFVVRTVIWFIAK